MGRAQNDSHSSLFGMEDFITYINLQKYATKYIDIYNMKYKNRAAQSKHNLFSMKKIKCKLFS